MALTEKVLVIKRAALNEDALFHGLNFQPHTLLQRIFTPGNLTFIPRPDAENDPSYKQIIPYVIMSCNDKILSYVRGKRAGESRLQGLRSIGIGGHINPVDEMALLDQIDPRATYNIAVDREVGEEVTINTKHTEKTVALLNDDSNEVGQVHLGIVHLWNLESPDVTKKEQMITQMTFMTSAELNDVRDSLETWSALCLELFNHS